MMACSAERRTRTSTARETNRAALGTSSLGSVTIDALLAGCESEALAALDDVSLAGLAAEIVALWPRLDAARLRLIAAVDQREAFKVDGARDAASWLAWKAGERRTTARRDVDLAAALATMPAVDAGLADGSLSKAKAAELSRVADADHRGPGCVGEHGQDGAGRAARP